MPDAEASPEAFAADMNRLNQLCRARASRRLLKAHPDEYAELLHEESHRAGLAHRHGPNHPETISWWGGDGVDVPDESTGGARKGDR